MSDCQPSYVVNSILFQDSDEELLPIYMDDEYDDDFFQFADTQYPFQPPSGHDVDEQYPYLYLR